MEELHYPRPCGCTGIRSCLVCEAKDIQVKHVPTGREHLQELWRYCYLCGKIQPPPHSEVMRDKSTQSDIGCPDHHATQGFVLPGIQVIPDFITDQEEVETVHRIERSPWKASQSGRLKQDYGPKPNFKRRKVKQGGFTGLPTFSKPLVSRMNRLPELGDFLPVEQCHLEYTPDRGSAIDLHFDDFWLWGNRLVTINLLSDTSLLLKYETDTSCHGAPGDSGTNCHNRHDKHNVGSQQEEWLVHELLIPMPRKSLIILSDDARYKWKHAIPREAILARRIAVTLRELATDFLPGGRDEALGQELLDIALTYDGTVVP
ncbi:alpha-ketoglutarate-dependent dioxygenase alkB homolog 4-like [Lytechinus pictus]|uniref:alpha-ketoglutarate-dependent dioxygenase alkB homolog 4-like n=1 Tax=Lytechinus pictus TaxID=7653 RepID=UPI00240D6ACD|nr:alpha-ketoglutarate-dependent dioxygenase alkB homolog 4-like [Lytechinus pictus]